MRPGTDLFQIQIALSDPASRHVTLSRARGMITEVERIGRDSDSGDLYILRHQKASKGAARVLAVEMPLDPMSWTGFRYGDANWSFVKRACLQNAD